MLNCLDENNQVAYCPHCLSLAIRVIDRAFESDYCDECGNTQIEIADFDTWEKMYEEKYGHKYLIYNNK